MLNVWHGVVYLCSTHNLHITTTQYHLTSIPDCSLLYFCVQLLTQSCKVFQNLTLYKGTDVSVCCQYIY
jgi:hypothetical protein